MIGLRKTARPGWRHGESAGPQRGNPAASIASVVILACFSAVGVAANDAVSQRLFEATFESKKVYLDPFNDVDVDVIFSKEGRTWRVPAFWRGGSTWAVRFAPREPGDYAYYLASTDAGNTALNGHRGNVRITAYSGPNSLLRHGMFGVSASKRHFEHDDGTPFYWLGDTWYTAFSDRLPWEGFKKLADDRKSKGFTVIQAAMMTCSNEETAPSDPGFCNEGGCVWDEQFRSINPRYFDYADRRVEYLIEAGLAPALFGAWHQALEQMGIAKMKKYWRYLVARYGAYPVFWVGGGEIRDAPPGDAGEEWAKLIERELKHKVQIAGWTDVVRYIREIDPYHHPLSVHELPPPLDTALQEETLTDFDLFQPGHFGAASIATQIALLNTHYARTSIKKPLVVAEIGWETLGGEHLENDQRAAFWLAMVNGAAGFSYGNGITGESYSPDKRLHRTRYSLLTWEEAMSLPSSRQVGLGASMLKRYPWQEFVPHPEWVTPRGTTLLEPRAENTGFDIDLLGSKVLDILGLKAVDIDNLPAGEWQQRQGTFKYPYATGILGKIRVIYIPARGFWPHLGYAPTVLNLEEGTRYRAHYWEPVLGVKFDLGFVEKPKPGPILRKDHFENGKSGWVDVVPGARLHDGRLYAAGAMLSILPKANVADALAAVDIHTDADAALLLRYRDRDNYLAAIYSAQDKSILLRERHGGVEGSALGSTSVAGITFPMRLTVEAREDSAIVSASDGKTTSTSPIVDVKGIEVGAVGLMRLVTHQPQSFGNFELRASPELVKDAALERKLRDAAGIYRGELKGPGWDDYARKKKILLHAYRPEKVPFPQDWVLILEAHHLDFEPTNE